MQKIVDDAQQTTDKLPNMSTTEHKVKGNIIIAKQSVFDLFCSILFDTFQFAYSTCKTFKSGDTYNDFSCFHISENDF